MRTPKMTIRAETARGLKPSRPQRGANKIESEPTYISGHFQRNGRTKVSYSANSPAVDPRVTLTSLTKNLTKRKRNKNMQLILEVRTNLTPNLTIKLKET